MSTFAIDTERQKMVATGISQPALEWIETAEGKRKPGEVQARDADTGMPLWSVEVAYRSESFGRLSTLNALVTVGALEQPQPAAFTPITFDGLRVNVYLTSAGGMSERWAAESVRHLTPENARPRAVEPKPGDSKAVA